MLGSVSHDAVSLLHSLALGGLVGLLLRTHIARVTREEASLQGRQSVRALSLT